MSENPVDRYIRQRDAERAWVMRLAAIRAESEHWRTTAFYLARAARKSQRMPLNPRVLEPIGNMRRRAERARRQWASAVVAML